VHKNRSIVKNPTHTYNVFCTYLSLITRSSYSVIFKIARYVAAIKESTTQDYTGSAEHKICHMLHVGQRE